MDANEGRIAAPKSKRTGIQAGGREGSPDQKYLRSLLQALQAVRAGDFSARLPTDEVGLAGKIADMFNDIVSAN